MNCEMKIVPHMNPKTGDLPVAPAPPNPLGDHGTGFRRDTSPMLDRKGKSDVVEKTHTRPATIMPPDANCTVSRSLSDILYFIKKRPFTT